MNKTARSSIMALSLATTALLLSACGSSSSTDTTTTPTVTTGQLVDNYVANADYVCADGTTGVTDNNGTFTCPTLPVRFEVGGLQLGEVAALATDRQVFPQDLLGVTRDDINNSDVIAMAQFLQSCDADANPQNGILIKEEIKSALADLNTTFDAADLDYYATEANLTLVNQETAQNHLRHSVDFVEHVDSTDAPIAVKDALLTPLNDLTQDAKDTLSFMGNEERLAHDLYLELYNYHVENGNGEVIQLTNIATGSETTHIQTVQSLIKKYDLNTSDFTNIDLPELGYKDTPVDAMVMGTYDIQEIQDLHDTLLAYGQASTQAALEVGCMVEVTDIDDLLVDIESAKASGASDVTTAFEFLRDGSYSHYWSFDQGLKNMGITDGCCSLGDAYCHPEFPQDTKGSDNAGSGDCNTTTETTQPQDGTGQRKGKQ